MNCNFAELKTDIELIKSKITECKNKNITDSFDIEMKLLQELPEQYNQYPWLIKRLCKSSNDEILNKFLEELEHVAKGDKSLGAVEMNLGLLLKEIFLDPVINKK